MYHFNRSILYSYVFVEKILVDELDKVKNKIENEQEDFKSVLNTISSLYNPLNNFFVDQIQL